MDLTNPTICALYAVPWRPKALVAAIVSVRHREPAGSTAAALRKLDQLAASGQPEARYAAQKLRKAAAATDRAERIRRALKVLR
jgi:hypothetical protein